ncbi:hypothetical protein H5410_055495 [Solanum commersonii]|uniref:Dihydrolipoamide acetyltransferase component of pyruvate dehydrogenase complex n=1 Tax=Solanum commersonii TaxID=4109 RepID=A0A9J5WHR2_SOLCO|nr:hypothetical protein H5410_055495 [Solanum commersonii]
MSHLLQSTFIPTTPTTLRRRSVFPTTHLRKTHVVESKIREIFMPALSSTMTEGKIISWMKTEGDKLAKGESVVVVESDKADMDVESFYDGYLASIIVPEGSSAPVGSPIALLAESEDEISLAKSKTPTPTSISSPAATASVTEEVSTVAAAVTVTSSSDAGPVKMASSIHPASEGGKRVVASPGVVGSGPNGRIVAKDVEAAAGSAPIGVAAAAKPSGGAPAAPTVELGTTVPFTTMQNAVSRNMVESLAVPTFRVGYTITTNALDSLYKKVKSKGVTMTALLAKATALALVKHPVVNSSCRDGKSFTYNSSINIAVAVAIDGGLITLYFRMLTRLIYTHCQGNGRSWLIRPGLSNFNPMNTPQVNVTADHRVIYGADLAAFLQTLAQIIEDPKDLTL